MQRPVGGYGPRLRNSVTTVLHTCLWSSYHGGAVYILEYTWLGWGSVILYQRNKAS
jgi:hypothetical protein